MSHHVPEAAASPPALTAPQRSRQHAGRFLRRVWRLHFYAALFAAPFLIVLSLTGLVILYTGPIQEIAHRGLVTVTPGSQAVDLDMQREVAERAAAQDGSDLQLVMVVPPAAADRATVFEFVNSQEDYVDYYVDPYRAQVLGSSLLGDDLVGLANRLHGTLNNDSVTVGLPSLAAMVDPELDPTVEVPWGGLIVEVAAIWGLVLALTGIYLWWPRSTQKGKTLLRVRWSKRGRLRWKDLHSASGILLAGLLAFFVISGMPWSDYWGSAWASVAERVTPNDTADEPVSSAVKAGDLDRFGNRIPWATRTDRVPASAPQGAGHQHDHGGGSPTGSGSGGVTPVAPLALAAVAKAAQAEGLLPGYSITLPVDDVSDPENPVYGTYQLSNPWPGRLEDEKVFYLDQFTGEQLQVSGPLQWGALQSVTEWGVQNHMGTQFGLVTRLLMTAGCLLIVVSVVSALVLWWKRRPKGSLGLPRRPVERGPAVAFLVIGAVLAVLYPAWGVTAIAVLLVDGLVGLVRRGRAGRAAG